MSGRLTLLVADDYPQNRRLFSLFLKKAYDVIEATSAQEVIDVLEREHVDAALLDLNYQGGMDGLELIALIREDSRWAGLPAIALTAHASPEDRDRCLQAGFDDFVSKPVFRDPLLETVATVVQRRRLAA